MTRRPRRPGLTAEQVRELLDCDPEQGRLIWKARAKPSPSNWNARWAGTEAGYLDPSTGYRRIEIDGHPYPAHRVIWLWCKGWLPRRDIDHRDGDKTNCAIGNLRPATKVQNAQNRRPPTKRGDAPPGCSWDQKRQKWQVYVRKSGKNHFVDRFTSREAASRAYQDVVADLHGAYAFNARPAEGKVVA
jgi:hypothetical protein